MNYFALSLNLINQQMKTDAQIQKDVMDELKWEPFLNEREVFYVATAQNENKRRFMLQSQPSQTCFDIQLE